MFLLSYAARISISVHFAKKDHFFLRKVWLLLFFVLPLHSLLRPARLSCCRWASFFDRIYMDREVVREASAAPFGTADG